MARQFRLTGREGVKREIERYRRKYPQLTAEALYMEEEAVLSQSKLLVPVDTGRLRASGYAETPTIGLFIEGEVGYETKYAVPVHENLSARHSVGQAKFLEVPAQQRSPIMAGKMAVYIRTRAAV